MIFDGNLYGWLPRKLRAYVKRRIIPFPVYSASGLVMNAYQVKNTRRMRKIGQRGRKKWISRPR